MWTPLEIELERVRKGIKKMELAAQMGMDPSLLGRKLRGQGKWKRDEYRRVCELVGLDPDGAAHDENSTLARTGSAGSGSYAAPFKQYMGPPITVTVKGDSMSPALENGWIVSVRRCEWNAVKPGDIVLVAWAQSEEVAFYEAFPRGDGSIRLFKRNTEYKRDERDVGPDEVLQLIASVSLVVGVVRKGAR